MTTAHVARRAIRAVRRLWLRAIVALVALTAITLACAPAARAQDPSPDESPTGRFHPGVYQIYYEFPPVIRSEDCGIGDGVVNFPWTDVPLPFLPAQVAGQGLNQATCRDVDLSVIADAFFGLGTEIAFDVTRTATMIGVWVIERAYSFDIAEWVVGPAVAVSGRLQAQLVEGISLGDFLLFIAVFYSGYHILRRRTALGIRELVVSLLVAVIGATLVTENPGWALDSALPHAIAMSGAMLEITSDESDVTAGASKVRPLGSNTTALLPIVRPLTDKLQDAMIGQPYELIQWGEPLEDDNCVEANDAILAEIAEDIGVGDALARSPSPIVSIIAHGNINSDRGDFAREKMGSAEGCEGLAEFNAKATGGRLMGAILSGLISVIATLMFVLIAIVIIGAQFVLAQMLAIAPLAVTVGVVPGVGREILVRWLGVIVQALAAIVVMSFVLTLYLQLTTTIMGLDDEMVGGYYERFALLLIAVIMVFRARKKLLTMVEQIIERTLERMAQREEGRSSADWGGLLDPGNMLRFGAGTLLAQKALQVGPGMVGRGMRTIFSGFRPSKAAREAAAAGGTAGGVPAGGVPAGPVAHTGPAVRRRSHLRRTLGGAASLLTPSGQGRAFARLGRAATLGTAGVGAAGKGTVRGLGRAGRWAGSGRNWANAGKAVATSGFGAVPVGKAYGRRFASAAQARANMPYGPTANKLLRYANLLPPTPPPVRHTATADPTPTPFPIRDNRRIRQPDPVPPIPRPYQGGYPATVLHPRPPPPTPAPHTVRDNRRWHRPEPPSPKPPAYQGGYEATLLDPSTNPEQPRIHFGGYAGTPLNPSTNPERPRIFFGGDVGTVLNPPTNPTEAQRRSGDSGSGT